ncbi:glycosyltransferase [Maribacter sp. 1_MG-2023]|uniref:glycosyltransferase n=1 Tax=Maribacter sp. 1_MG-2023 TaxID=3062677 RepID=UPI0026E118DA|nr:glycosyltransferase [Maribacter sp. 1_MG-2023]MDO6472181.1 glycosyltransferase [Maribacter sp. 1_MG-2023]
MTSKYKSLPVIVIIAFNRPDSLSRILHSISEAKYPKENVNLIISIDKSDNNQDVLDVANKFDWKNGDKKVKYQSKNLGLRKHILKCMSFASEYGSMIMLEDDLYVSPDYYNYSKQALEFSENNENIAGISLYNHQYNVHKQENFITIEDGYDNYYFQFASSWGQAWNAQQIKFFLDWYNQKIDINKLDGIPTYVSNWSEKSWLKHFIAYTVSQDKFFIYPKISLTTNFGDEGANMDVSNTYYQVPILLSSGKKYNFSTLNESRAIYDVYFENLCVSNELNLDKKDITIDLYGIKPLESGKRYLLTSLKYNYKIIKSFARSFKPHDLNIIYNIHGTDFFLYDTNVKSTNNIKIKSFDIIDYNKKTISLTESFVIFKHKFIQRLLIFFGK